MKISAMELRLWVGRYLKGVRENKKYVITWKGKPIARLIPYKNPELVTKEKENK